MIRPSPKPIGPAAGTRGRPAEASGIRGFASDPLISALGAYVEALDARYPGGPDQFRREGLDGRAKVSRMTRIRKEHAA